MLGVKRLRIPQGNLAVRKGNGFSQNTQLNWGTPCPCKSLRPKPQVAKGFGHSSAELSSQVIANTGRDMEPFDFRV